MHTVAVLLALESTGRFKVMTHEYQQEGAMKMAPVGGEYEGLGSGQSNG